MKPTLIVAALMAALFALAAGKAPTLRREGEVSSIH